MSLSQLNENLWLGAEADLAAAVAAGCTAIVNVAADVNYSPPVGVSYNKIGLQDDGTDACNQYEAVVDTVNGLIADGDVVFLHCHVGINRGPTMAMLYYHEYYNYTWDEARAFVVAKHPDASPWPSLWNTVTACFPDPAEDPVTCLGVECCESSRLIQAAITTVTPVTYVNTRQCATASCPDGFSGSPVTICKEAGTFSSPESVADANAQAYAAALAQASNGLHCTEDVVYYSTQTECVTCPNSTQPVNLVPNMVGYNAPSGVVTASSEHPSTPAWHAFSNNGYQATWGAPWVTMLPLPQWLEYQFPSAQTVTTYMMHALYGFNGAAPMDFQLLGSNDGATWDVLDSRVGYVQPNGGVGIDDVLTVATPGSYLYYRLYVTAVTSVLEGGFTLQLYRLYLNGTTAGQVCETASASSTASQDDADSRASAAALALAQATANATCYS